MNPHHMIARKIWSEEITPEDEKIITHVHYIGQCQSCGFHARAINQDAMGAAAIEHEQWMNSLTRFIGRE